jgi:hypothetical protein
MWNVIETLLDLNKERKLGLELWQCEELAKWICLVFRQNIKDLDYVRADTHMIFRPESRINPKEEYHVYTNIYAYNVLRDEYKILEMTKKFDAFFEVDGCLKHLKEYTELSLVFPVAFEFYKKHIQNISMS